MAITDVPPGCLIHGVPIGQICYRCSTGPFFGIPSFPAFPVMPATAGWACPRCGGVYAPWVHACQACALQPQVTSGARHPAHDQTILIFPHHLCTPERGHVVDIGRDWCEVIPGLGARALPGAENAVRIEFRPGPEPETCCVCGSADVRYHGLEDGRPLCAACSASRRTIEPRAFPDPCQPSREGGMCGCGEPDAVLPYDGDAVYIRARDGATPDEIRDAQDHLNGATNSLAVGRFVVTPPGSRVVRMPDPLTLHLPPVTAEEGNYRVVRLGAGFSEILPGLEAAAFFGSESATVTLHLRDSTPRRTTSQAACA